MAIATGTALAIGIGAKVATDIYGAKKQGDAAEKAAGQQIAAAERARREAAPLYDRALQIAQEQHAQGRADLGPWAQQGRGGLTALSDFLGVPMTAPVAAPAPPSAPPGPALPGPIQAIHRGPEDQAQLEDLRRQLNPPHPRAVGTTRGASPATVLLRAPNGQTQAVAPEQVDFFLARGATRV